MSIVKSISVFLGLFSGYASLAFLNDVLISLIVIEVVMFTGFLIAEYKNRGPITKVMI